MQVSKAGDGRNANAVIIFRCSAESRDELKALARREGEASAVIIRRLIADALFRARSGQPLLRAS